MHHVVIQALVNGNKASTLIDSASTSQFISTRFAHQQYLDLIPLATSKLMTFDYGGTTNMRVTHATLVSVMIGDTADQHVEQLLAFVTDVHYDLVLGRPWLAVHEPETRWKEGSIILNSQHCRTRCSSARPAVATSQERTFKRRERRLSGSPHGEEIDLCEVPATAICALAHRPDAQVFSLWIQEVHGDRPGPPLSACATSAEDFEKFMAASARQNNLDKLPVEYHDLADCISRNAAKELSPPRPGCDLEIELKEGVEPPHKNPYPMSALKNEATKKWIDDQLAQGFIRKSTSPAAAPMIVVRQPGGGLRVCVDYRALNALTIKNRYPIPLVRDTLASVSTNKWFTKLDIIAAFNRIRVAKGYE